MASFEENKLRLGIIGCANIAKKICAAIKCSSNIQLVAIASRTLDKVQLFAQENGLDADTVRLYDNYDAVLTDSTVQAVYIPLPTVYHLEWVTKAANAKKHIIIEKPVAINASEFQQMIKICQENNVFIMDGTMFVHHPRTALLKSALRDPSCGPLHRVQSCLTFPANPHFFETNIRTKSDADPLGAIGDLGWYCVRIGLLAYSFKANHTDDTFIRYPISAQSICTRWTHDGVPLEFHAYVWFSEDKSDILSFDCSFYLPFRQKFEITCSSPSSEYGDQIISGDDFVLPFSSTEASFIIDIAPLPGKLQNVDPDPHTFQTIIGDTTTGTQQTKMLEYFGHKILSGEYQQPDASYWANIALATQSVLDAIFISMKNNGMETPVVRYDH